MGALGDPEAGLSAHLRSRQECGLALRESGVPVTELRAGVIIGSGSLSFEMIRHLAERLPVMVCPKWIYSRIQPIAISDLLDYLAAVLEVPECTGLIIEVGGRDATTYRGLMLGYARARGLRRILAPVPVLTPRLSSYWVHWTTPIPAPVAAALAEGLRNDVVVTNDLVALALFPNITPRDYASAIKDALEDLDQGRIDTSWSDASGGSTTAPGTGERGIPRRGDHGTPHLHRIRPGGKGFSGVRQHRRGQRLVLRQLGLATAGDAGPGTGREPACAGDGAFPTNCGSATLSISGVWRPWRTAYLSA